MSPAGRLFDGLHVADLRAGCVRQAPETQKRGRVVR